MKPRPMSPRKNLTTFDSPLERLSVLFYLFIYEKGRT